MRAPPLPYPFPFTLSLITGEHRNVTTVLESKVKSSLVTGFLPFRGAFFFTENFPNPLIVRRTCFQMR
jgi:hypothetical protein